jgi:hypothetical protein
MLQSPTAAQDMARFFGADQTKQDDTEADLRG